MSVYITDMESSGFSIETDLNTDLATANINTVILEGFPYISLVFLITKSTFTPLVDLIKYMCKSCGINHKILNVGFSYKFG